MVWTALLSLGQCLRFLLSPFLTKKILVSAAVALFLALGLTAFKTTIIEPRRRALPQSVELIMPKGNFAEDLGSKIETLLKKARAQATSRAEFERALLGYLESHGAVARVQLQSHLLGKLRAYVALHKHAMRVTDQEGRHYFLSPSMKLMGWSSRPDRLQGLPQPEIRLVYEGSLRTRQSDPLRIYLRSKETKPLGVHYLHRKAVAIQAAVASQKPSLLLEPQDTITYSPKDGFFACMRPSQTEGAPTSCTALVLGHFPPEDLAVRLGALLESGQLESSREIDFRIEGRALIEARPSDRVAAKPEETED